MAQLGPPQSTPVSLPLRTLSLHEAAAQTPLRHTPVAQSLPTRHPTSRRTNRNQPRSRTRRRSRTPRRTSSAAM